jgi:protein lifeguard
MWDRAGFKWWYVAIACVGALLFCAYLVYHIQLVMGKGKYAISPDEYVFAALQIYMDVVGIFLYILAIIGGSSR